MTKNPFTVKRPIVVPHGFDPSENAERLLQKVVEEGHIRDTIELQKQQRILDLRARSKPKEELIKSIDCIVEFVKGTVQKTTYSSGPLIIGGYNHTYAGGDQSQTEIIIASNTPVNTIYFRGWPPLEKGDRISAYIFKGKEESEDPEWIPYPSCIKPISHYVEREWQEKETAIKIEKLRNKKVVAEYNAPQF